MTSFKTSISQVLNLRQELIHCRAVICLLRIKFMLPSLHGKFSVILQFQNNLWRDFLDEVCSSLLILQIFFGFPVKLRQPIGLLHVL